MARARRRSKSKPIPLGDLVRQTAPGKAAAQVVVSRAVWQEVAGVGFARRTRPMKVHRGTLYVQVASAGWAQELGLVERVVIERLRARGVPVERLRFTVGEVDAPERGGVYGPPKSAVDRARALEIPEEAARAVSKVRDGDLREVLARTARALARRQAEVDLKAEAAAEGRAIPRLPGEAFPRRGGAS